MKKLFAMLCLMAAATVSASGPVSAYAIVDKVIFEPNETSPERVQIWGVFSVSTERFSSSYSAVQKGYLYYSMKGADKNSENAIRAAWADLKRVAGTGEAISFGGGFGANEGAGRVRKVDEKPKSPDLFPLGNPVTRLGASQPEMVARLKAATRTK